MQLRERQQQQAPPWRLKGHGEQIGEVLRWEAQQSQERVWVQQWHALKEARQQRLWDRIPQTLAGEGVVVRMWKGHLAAVGDDQGVPSTVLPQQEGHAPQGEPQTQTKQRVRSAHPRVSALRRMQL